MPPSSKPIWPWVNTDGGVDAPPILVYFGGDWDVHRGYGILTHDHLTDVDGSGGAGRPHRVPLHRSEMPGAGLPAGARFGGDLFLWGGWVAGGVAGLWLAYEPWASLPTVITRNILDYLNMFYDRYTDRFGADAGPKTDLWMAVCHQNTWGGLVKHEELQAW